MLVLENVTLSCSQIELFSGLGLCLLPGSLLIIEGNNGAGKTSLLKAIAGLKAVDSGKIYISMPEQDDEYSPPPHAIYIGIEHAFYDDFTVRNNLKIIADLYSTNFCMSATVRLFNLEPYFDHKFKLLSHGWQKRVSLARLMLSNREIWLLDEPFVGLDSQGTKALIDMINSRTSTGGIVIISQPAMQSDLLKQFNQNPLSIKIENNECIIENRNTIDRNKKESTLLYNGFNMQKA